MDKQIIEKVFFILNKPRLFCESLPTSLIQGLQ